MSGLPPGTQDTGLAALMGGGFAPPLGAPIPLHQPTSAPPAPTDPMAAVLAPVRDRVSSGESGGSDPYHETYGGGHFGWQGVPNTGSGKYGFVKSTWDETVRDMLAAQGGPVPDFNNPHDQDRVFDFKATKTYGIDSKGRNLAQASKAGDVEYGRLAQVWPSLAPAGGPKTWFTGPDAMRLGMTEAYQQQQALDKEHLAAMHDEMAAIQKKMTETSPDSQEYRKLLRQQIDASQAIEARYLRMAQNPPTRTMPDLFSGFGSLALLVAAIGGRHSRQPATASLNAAAGALQGIQQNNQQQFEDNFKTWQAQTQALNNALTAQNDVFRNILENEHLDDSQRMEKLNEAFKLFDMSEASFALEHGMLDKAMQFPQTLATAQQNMELTNAQIGHLKAQTDNLAAGGNVTQHLDAGRLDANGNPTPYVQDKQGNAWTVQTQVMPDGTTQQVRTPYTPVRPSNLSSAPQGLPPEVKVPDRWEGMPNKAPPDVRQDVWDAALAAVQSGKLPTGGFGNSALKNQVTSLFPAAAHALGIPDSEIAQQWGKYQADVRRMTSVESAFGSGMAGRNLVSLNTVAAHLTLLREYAEALQNHDLPAANQIINRMSTQAGMPQVIQFALARTITADEVVRLLTTTGGTVEDRAGLQRLLSEYGSPAQIFGAIDTAGQFVKERLGPLEQQYARNDPERRQEFENNMLTPEARRVYLSSGSSSAGGLPPPPNSGVVIQNGWRYDAKTHQPIGPVQ